MDPTCLEVWVRFPTQRNIPTWNLIFALLRFRWFGLVDLKKCFKICRKKQCAVGNTNLRTRKPTENTYVDVFTASQCKQTNYDSVYSVKNVVDFIVIKCDPIVH